MLLSTDISYGLAIVSVQEFEKHKKESKIRARKMLSYFARNNNIGNGFSQKGFVIPIGRIDLGNYYIGIGTLVADIPAPYEPKCEWAQFNLCVGSDNAVWAISLGELDNWNSSFYENKVYRKLENVFRYDEISKTDVPAEDYCGIRFDIPRGNYKVKIIGLKNSNDSVKRDGQYGFYFLLTAVEGLSHCDDATEVDFNAINQT